jgi:hypothetical protein
MYKNVLKKMTTKIRNAMRVFSIRYHVDRRIEEIRREEVILFAQSFEKTLLQIIQDPQNAV